MGYRWKHRWKYRNPSKAWTLGDLRGWERQKLRRVRKIKRDREIMANASKEAGL